MTPMKAIRLKCLDCCCNQVNEVRLCPCRDCSLYAFRMGKNPNRQGIANKGSFAPKSTAQLADLAHLPPREYRDTTQTTPAENTTATQAEKEV